MKQGLTIRGLTTAAALWCVAAIGLAAGLGLYVIAAVTAALVLLVLWGLNFLEARLPKKLFRLIVVRRAWGAGCLAQTIERVEKHGVRVVGTSFKRTDDLSAVDLSLRITYTQKMSYATLERELLEASDGFQVISAGEVEN